MEKFDLIIIGGGGEGFAAAMKASDLGAKAVIVKADCRLVVPASMSGVCLLRFF